MSDDLSWYVVAREPREGDYFVNVFGPFFSETDARAFALDMHNDNGWEYLEAEHLSPEAAQKKATDRILWPYTKEEI